MSKYDIEYHKKYQRQFKICVNRKTEPRLLAWLEKQDNITGYIKGLIRGDMAASKGKRDTKPVVLPGQLMVMDDASIRGVDE